jgi:YVTN family beta-propeller protein
MPVQIALKPILSRYLRLVATGIFPKLRLLLALDHMLTPLRFAAGIAVFLLCVSFSPPLRPPQPGPFLSVGLQLLDNISGPIQPKSIVHSGKGTFFAQNMMYEHSVTVYDRNLRQIHRLSDEVVLSSYGYTEYPESARYKGAPVECAFSHKGKYAWVSNYSMTGPGFTNPGDDDCTPGGPYDPSFIYKVNAENFRLEEVVKVGSVPKYLAATPDDRYILVSNWCSGDLSVVDTRTSREIRKIFLGVYPRGIAVDAGSRYAYVALMGEGKIAVVRLSDFTVSYIKNVGLTPRHLCIEETGRYLFVSLSRPGKVVKYDLLKKEVKSEVYTGAETRSMVLAPNQQVLYVVSYQGNMLLKLGTSQMEVLDKISTQSKPIGVTFDAITRTVWVSCYSSVIQVFKDFAYPETPISTPTNTYVTTPDMHDKDPFVIPLLKNPQDQLPYVVRPERDVPNGVRTERDAHPEVTAVQTSRGTTPAPAQVPPARMVASLPDGPLKVVVGTFSSPDNAQRETEYLRKNGFPYANSLPFGDKWRVIAGAFSDRAMAEAATEYLRSALSRDSWILTP